MHVILAAIGSIAVAASLMVIFGEDNSVDKWLKSPATFRDSNGYIPNTVLTKSLTNDELIFICSVMIQEYFLKGELSIATEQDLGYCVEFYKHTESQPWP